MPKPDLQDQQISQKCKVFQIVSKWPTPGAFRLAVKRRQAQIRQAEVAAANDDDNKRKKKRKDMGESWLEDEVR